MTRQLVDLCLQAVGRFREWERAELLLKTPCPSLLTEHAKTSAWLIRLLAQLHAAASDPDGTQLNGPRTCGLVPVKSISIAPS